AEAEITQKSEELSTLYEITQDLAMERDLSKLLRVIVEKATGLLKASAGGLYLCDSENRQVRCVVSYNTPRDYTGTILAYGEGAAGTVAEAGKPLVIKDYRVWQGRAAIFEQDQPFTSVLSVPIKWQGQVIGVLHVLENMQVRSFTEEDLQ